VSIFINFAVNRVSHCTDFIQLILNISRNIKKVSFKLSNVLSLGNNENRVQLKISTLPFIEKTYFLIEIRFESVNNGFFFFKSGTISISYNRDQEISEDKQNEQKVEEPDEPTHIDHQHRVPSKTFFLFLFQVCTPFRIIWGCHIVEGISPGGDDNTNELMEVRIIVLWIAGSN